ncbi:MAG: hypothetical protein J4F28_08430 [Nitrosopumilaceae archaeon]|nr:hypothetical protein [Nitrosopumilaceae archaeon]
MDRLGRNTLQEYCAYEFIDAHGKTRAGFVTNECCKNGLVLLPELTAPGIWFCNCVDCVESRAPALIPVGSPEAAATMAGAWTE